MSNLNDFHLRYPIGKFKYPDQFDAGLIPIKIEQISKLPNEVEALVNQADFKLLKNTYRPDGWTAIQVIHHLADSHMNAFVRFKLSITEDNPTIKPYVEGLWANTNDAKIDDIKSSIQILKGLHARWSILLESMSEADFMRTFYHPEQQKSINLFNAMCLYAWHGNHHLAHVNLAISS